ncbi:MAG: hypothetical protein AAF752_09480 [Bacteroidota bacterium]
MIRLFLLGLSVLLAAGCGGSDSSAPTGSGDLVRVSIDKKNADRLLAYYFGGYASSAGADPFETGLLQRVDGSVFLDRSAFAALHPGMVAALDPIASDGDLGWKELVDFFQATYYDARNVPTSLSTLETEAGFTPESGWFEVAADGVMTVARRHVFVPEPALREAIAQYKARDEQVLYPIGTTVFGRHQQGEEILETTVMRKRDDGYWDYFTYDQAGQLAAATSTEPRALKTPTQCAGCHLGSRPFEPERSFPAKAADGPHGPRAIYVPAALRNGEIVSFFDEHRKRSDTLLGLYATLYTAELVAQREAGTLSQEDADLLNALGI